MKINIETPPSPRFHCDEGDLFVDGDGDLNIVVAATHIKGVRDSDLVVCCVHKDAAWIRGLADADHLADLRRLSSGDSVTLTVE